MSASCRDVPATLSENASPEIEAGSRGFIFAATGGNYVTAARRAARTLRLHMPGVEIDLFADAPPDDPVFDREHRLADGFFRPKIEALRRSRFERTVYLDTDVLVLAPVPELFDALDACEIAAAPGVSRVQLHMRRVPDVPRTFPVLNTGVLCVRNNPRMRRFLLGWERALRARGERVDQAVFRLMIHRRKVRFLPLGYEYNVKVMNCLDIWRAPMGAPRILHCSGLNALEASDPIEPFRLEEALPQDRVRRIEALMTLDPDLRTQRTISKTEIAAARRTLASLDEQESAANQDGADGVSVPGASNSASSHRSRPSLQK